MLKVVHSTLRQLHMIAPGDKVVLGVSGGADSVALFLQLYEYKSELEFDMEVVHVNHLIRKDAGDDANFVRELCKSRNIPFHLFEVDVKRLAKDMHLSTEEAGRKVRYDAMRSLNPNKIAVGHHSDDLTETVLLNLCRGTGIHGMAGIAPVQDDIIRPLLYVSREDIEGYLTTLCQPYRIDSTNLTDDYTRNKVRLNVLPYLNREINEQTSGHIVNLSRDMLELEALINRITEKAYDDICDYNKDKREIRIDQKGLHNLDDYVKRELILKAMERLTPRRKDITRNHVESILNITDKSGEKRLSLPYNLEALSSYNTLIIRKKYHDEEIIHYKDTKEYEIVFNDDSLAGGVQMTLPDGRTVSARIFGYDGKLGYPDSRCTKWFDYDKINESVTLRYRRAGDYLTVSDTMQRKALKDYMINEKIPRELRDNYLLLADGDHIVWVPGYRISAYYKIGEQTRNVLEVNII